MLGLISITGVKHLRVLLAKKNSATTPIFFFKRSSVEGTVGNCISSFKLDVRKYSFSQRVINHWNALTQHGVDCNMVSSFKRCLDRYIEDRDS